MGSINKIVKRSPGFIKKLYYSSVPFSKRYGKVYENTLSFLMESSNWDIETKKEYQLTQMQNLLRHCYLNVPFYKQIFIDNNWKPEDFRTVDDLKNFPELTKKIIMDNSNAMVASNLSWAKGYPITTSRSSGDKLKFYVNDDVMSFFPQLVHRFDSITKWFCVKVHPSLFFLVIRRIA